MNILSTCPLSTVHCPLSTCSLAHCPLAHLLARPLTHSSTHPLARAPRSACPVLCHRFYFCHPCKMARCSAQLLRIGCATIERVVLWVCVPCTPARPRARTPHAARTSYSVPFVHRRACVSGSWLPGDYQRSPSFFLIVSHGSPSGVLHEEGAVGRWAEAFLPSPLLSHSLPLALSRRQ